MKRLWTWGLLALLGFALLVLWWGCFSVPVSVTDVFTYPEMIWKLKDPDRAEIVLYLKALQTPWQDRRIYRLFPDLDTRC